MTPKILVVDDDPYTRSLIIGLFRDTPTRVDTAPDADTARRHFRETDYNLILMDQRLPDANGFELVCEMRGERPRQTAILMTGFADIREAVRAVREGIFDYITKPFENLEELEVVIGRALELDRAYREIDSLRETLESRKSGPVLIGRSQAIERLLRQIRQIAPLDTTVLLEGESGTGKELVARLIHALSSRAKKSLLDVNCGALSEQLLESTLFGFEKGAFTGAAKTTPGFFEEANGSSLFLDEITDMSVKLQSSLLRVLQEKTFSRIGGTQRLSSDFRLICATNRTLAEAVKAKDFREDLYYRINVVALTIPPLRERREDISPLALYFLDHFNAKFAKSVGPFSPDAIAALETHHWPGNVRQLQHAVERIVALKPEGPVTSADLNISDAGKIPFPQSVTAFPSFQEAKGRFERAYLENLLDAAGGNVTLAAHLSGISRQNLYVRMNRLGVVSKL